jgi:uncharacterized protein (DUF1800 family)
MDRRAFIKGAGVPPLAPTATAHGADQPDESARLHALISAGGQSRNETLAADLSQWNPAAGEWNTHTVGHLYRRAGFGATLDETTAALQKTPSAIIDDLLSDNWFSQSKLPAPPMHAEDWVNSLPYYGSDFGKQLEQQQKYSLAVFSMRRWWVKLMAQPETMLRERMVLFYLNHFVVEATKVYFPQMLYRYMDLFRKNPWGNFKQLVKDVTIQPSMLYYLDGYLSYGQSPNENYARELLELFTMGPVDKDGNANYSEADIREIAKALTGYTIDLYAPAPNPLPAKYDVNRHDSRLKQPFGAPKKNYGLASSGVVDDDVIHVIFDKRGDQIAYYICSKLYQYFVYHEIGAAERAIIEQLATTFKNANWELKPVLSQLFKSAHFFDEENIGAAIKSPHDYLLMMMRQLDVDVDELNAYPFYVLGVAGNQVLLDPPNVKGWPGYRSWLSTTTLPQRNSAVATPFLTLKQIYVAGETGYGESYTALTLPDAKLISWAKKFEGYQNNFDLYLSKVAEFISARVPSAKAVQDRVRSKFPADFYEWSKATDTEKANHTRRLLNELMLLAEYQLS